MQSTQIEYCSGGLLKRQKNKITSKEERIFKIVIRIVLFLFVALTVIPILNVLALSFSQHSVDVILWPVGFNLFSFKAVFQDMLFWKALGVTLSVTALGTITSVTCMALAGYALSKPYLPFRKSIMIYFIISMLFSGGMVPNYILVSSLGLTDTIFALFLPNAVQVFHMILVKNYFEGLPTALEESAKIDGASNMTVFIKIILPISIPMIVTVSLFTAVVYWNNYFSALMYISSAHTELYPLSYYIIMLDDKFNDPNAAITLGEKASYHANIKAATIIMSMLPIVIAYPFFLPFFTKGIVVGAVKG